MSQVITFPSHRVSRSHAGIIKPKHSREYAIAKINQARDYLDSGQGDWFQRGHAEWLVEEWTRTLAGIECRQRNVVQLRRA